MAGPFNYDVTIQLGNERAEQFRYGLKGSLKLGIAAKEPGAPSRVDTIVIASLHHGMGRSLATDPMMARDSNSQNIAADLRSPGFILPGGTLTKLGTVAIDQAAAVETLQAYAAAFSEDDGDIVFAAGSQLIHIDIDDDTLLDDTALAADQFFTGSVVEWRADAWLGVMNAARVTIGAYNYDTDALNVAAAYMHSWAVSTRNTIHWIRNRSGASPEYRWSDRTDQDFGAFTSSFIHPSEANGYVLEIPKDYVSGMGSMGQYAVFGSRGGQLWGFDKNEVFIPLTPTPPGGFSDYRYGGPMSYVGIWLLVPNLDGLGRFDPRAVTLNDVSPAIHQTATPGIGTGLSKAAHATTPTPTGALVAANLLGATVNVSDFEMYEDGMFFHPRVLELTDGVSRIWGMIVTRGKTDSEFNSQLRAYILASDSAWDNWAIYRLDLATASWSPGPANIADTSGFRTGYYSGRPPDISGSATQIRSYARASADNPIQLWMQVDSDDEQYYLGEVSSNGPFVLPVPSEAPPGRKFAIAGKLINGDDAEDPCYLAMPLSIDYRYAEPPSPLGADYFTVKLEVDSSGVGKTVGRRIANGRTDTEWLVSLVASSITVGFADSKTQWEAIVESAESTLETPEDGTTESMYIVTLTCRRTK